MPSSTMAPTTDMMKPAACPSWYQPMARPAQVATNDPAMPISIVTTIPPGSLPGMMNFATAPMASPINNVHSRCIGSSSRARMACVYRALRRGGSIAQNGVGRQSAGLGSLQGREVRSPLLRGRGDYQFLADLDLVGIFQVVGLGDDWIFVGVTVEMLADLGQVVAGLHGIILGARLGFDVMFQVGEGWIDGLNGIPDAVFAGL